MFGLHSILESIDKTQRSTNELVPIPMEIDSDEKESTAYSSPSERPGKEPCFVCSKISGTTNDKQLEWISKVLLKHPVDSSSSQRIPMEIKPDIPLWSKPPVLDEYLLKPLFIWHPENQFGISIAKEKCPYCAKEGSVKIKEWITPRHIHCLSTDAYMVSVRYVCSRKMGGCKKTFAITDEEFVNISNLVPSSIFLKCPFQLFYKSGWKTDLIQTMFDLVSGRAKVNDFVIMVRNSRTSEYMKTACAYRDHVEYYSQLQMNRGRFASTESETIKFPDFPGFFQHCQGKYF